MQANTTWPRHSKANKIRQIKNIKRPIHTFCLCIQIHFPLSGDWQNYNNEYLEFGFVSYDRTKALLYLLLITTSANRISSFKTGAATIHVLILQHWCGNCLVLNFQLDTMLIKTPSFKTGTTSCLFVRSLQLKCVKSSVLGLKVSI